jgi:hypothetical protein
MSGANVLNGYSANIFKSIEQSSGGVKGYFTVTEAGYFIGLSGFIGALLGIFTVPYFTRRALLIGGHLLMGAFLLLVAVLIGFN